VAAIVVAAATAAATTAAMAATAVTAAMAKAEKVMAALAVAGPTTTADFREFSESRSQDFAPRAIRERSSLQVSMSSCEELLQATHPANCPLGSLHYEQYHVHRESKGLGMRERAIGDSATHLVRSPY